jgi:CxxC motif-containing protein
MSKKSSTKEHAGESREMICISCPIGCHLSVERTGTGEVRVEGNKCPRGEEYAREELLSPKRVVTATVSLKDGLVGRVPVKTDAPLLKEHIAELLQKIYAMELVAPVQQGQVLAEDLYGTGVKLITGRSIDKRR